ncbi:Sensor histidine kinase [Chitinispirillum alkaliphilum]|nr:Sensor histidine kinase [Chitinispirillum alkaliphilum]
MIFTFLNKLKNNRQFKDFFLQTRMFSVRNILLVICLVWLVFYLLFVYTLKSNLDSQTTQLSQARAELISMKISVMDEHEKLIEVFNEVMGNSCNPVIIVDSEGIPVYWKDIGTTLLGSSMSYTDNASDEELEKVRNLARKMRGKNTPFLIDTGSEVYGSLELVYANSSTVQMLAWMPFVEIGLVAVIILLIYISFRSIRITERSNLWVGLAKETAHQLGTPISSLMGWSEYLRAVCEQCQSQLEFGTNNEVCRICDDIDYDLKRLNKVAARFSQIGSEPDRPLCDIREVLNDTIDYFRVRLPLHKRKIDLTTDFAVVPLLPLNRDLVSWVIENLIKNSIDAISSSEGQITMAVQYVSSEKVIRFTQKDNGKGISREQQKRVFSPGFTTKKRGWGLGLTLAKRIIEDYHGGKIYVDWSQKQKGTEIVIELPVSPESHKVCKSKEFVKV